MRDRRKREARLSAFDTEGTSVFDDPRGPFAILYNWDVLDLDDAGAYKQVTRDTLPFMTTRHEGRDCASLYDFLSDELVRANNESYTRKIGVHNLSYDYAYLRMWLISCEQDGYSVECMAKSSTRVLTITIRDGKTPLMIFFDTLSLFNKSLRNLGESLGFEKEHIDYQETIAPDSIYDARNTNYNHRDTDVLMLAMCSSLLTQRGVDLDALGTRVLTKTSIVRKMDRDHERVGALKISVQKSRGKGKRKRTRKQGRQSKDYTIYDADRDIVAKYQYARIGDFMRWASYGDTMSSDVKGCYAGGVNLSNADYLAVTSKDVISYDLKSAYPSVMLSMSVPVKPYNVPADELASYKGLLEPCAPSPVDLMAGALRFWRGTVKLTNVREDRQWFSAVNDTSITESMVLQHRHESEGITWRDGHLSSADVLYLTICLPEWCELSLQYEWDVAEWVELTIYGQYQKPTWYTILRTIMHYREKSESKRLMKAAKAGTITQAMADGAEREGLITHDEAMELMTDPSDRWLESFVLNHKANLNSLYGIMVTNPMRDEYALNGEKWLSTIEQSDDDKMEAYEGSSRDGKMWREAGVMVALYNRYKIIFMARMLVEAGATVLYTDTDSIKFKGITKQRADLLFKPLHDAIEIRIHDVVGSCVDAVNEHLASYDKIRRVHTDPIEMPDDDEFRALGKLDYEGTYERFISMGHKKYAVWEKDRKSGRMEWHYRCSGYALPVLQDLSRQLMEDGLADVAPLIVLGYDVRYDSRTGIASAQSSIGSPWVAATIHGAKDMTGKTATHDWQGMTCPGFAIFDAGKIMNNTEHSPLNLQRYVKACRNNEKVGYLSQIDITYQAGSYLYGHRGSIPMAWQDWDLKGEQDQQNYL